VIEFSPPEEARLQAAAEREGVPITDIIRKAVTNYLPPVDETEAQKNAASIALLRSWLNQAPTDPEAVREAEEDLREFKKNLNFARKEAGGTRLPYPEVEQAA